MKPRSYGDVELVESLGRHDLCPCGSGRRFQGVLHGVGLLRRRQPQRLLSGSEHDAGRASTDGIIPRAGGWRCVMRSRLVKALEYFDRAVLLPRSIPELPARHFALPRQRNPRPTCSLAGLVPMPDTLHPHFEEVGELQCGRLELTSRFLVPHFADQAHQSLDVNGLDPAPGWDR